MTRIYLLVVFALWTAFSPAAACEIGPGTILAISAAGNTLLDVRVSSEGKEESVCLQAIPLCSWSGKPSSGFVDAIKNAKVSDEGCHTEFYRKNDIDYARRLTCDPSAPLARPLMFASRILAAVGNNRCVSPAVLSTTSEAVLFQARIQSLDLEYCVKFQWSKAGKISLSFAPACNQFKPSTSTPASPVSIHVDGPKASILFAVKLNENHSWILESVSAQPSTPYLSRWANTVLNLDVSKLIPPEDDRNRGTGEMQSSNLIGHWTAAMLFAGGITDGDLAVRAWMAELELGNHDRAKNTLLRSECIEPTDVASCH
ncbi:hypothetical protein ACLBXO_01865 [Methylobacterium sp. C33D]